MVVLIDSKEPKEAENWFKEQGLQLLLKRVSLETGDYLLRVSSSPIKEIAVERKTVSDYVNSIKDGRLFNQLYRLSRDFEISYLIVVGNVVHELLNTDFPLEAFYSSLVGSSLKRSSDGKQGQVITLTVPTNYEFAMCVYYLHKKLEEGDLIRRPRPVGGKSNFKSCLITLYSCIPGVSEKLAVRLAERFPSLESLVRATKDDIMSVKGIGEDKARRIYSFIHGL
jgi:DNA excision repair protein ERCC-4